MSTAELGGRIRQYREERGYSLSELARRASLSKSIVWGIERDARTRPSLQSVVDIAGALDVTVGDLIGENVGEGQRILWQGPLRWFLGIAMVIDYERWGITFDDDIQVRVAPTATAPAAGLTGQPTGGVLAVDAVGGDVVPEQSGKPASDTGDPPAGA